MRWLIGAGLIAAFFAFGLAIWLGGAALHPLPLTQPETLQVDRGTTLRPVLQHLARRGLLARPTGLYMFARLTGRTQVRSGEYQLKPGQNGRDVLEMVVNGRVQTATLTVLPGQNRWEIREALAAAGWIDREAFEMLCDDVAFLKAEKIPGPTCEGYLYPETYTFARGIAPRDIFKELFSHYRRAYSRATAQGRGPLNLEERDFVALASIVEKETGAPEERPRIACVFYNRLRAKPMWRLQTDPTVIYAATLEDANFDGNIRRYHLREMDNPYNTYKRIGLPPGPIASPGLDAFEAVANPATCNDFFFVSMNNGRHVFCPDITCHTRAVQKWQVDYFRRKAPSP